MTYQYPYGGMGIFHDFFGINFSIVHATNTGAAWGLFAGFQEYLLYFRIFFVAMLFIYVLFFNKQFSHHLPLFLIITGAVGNIIDYFIYGHVVDLFYFNFWGYSYPVFNVADAAIFSGVALYIIRSGLKKSYVS